MDPNLRLWLTENSTTKTQRHEKEIPKRLTILLFIETLLGEMRINCERRELEHFGFYSGSFGRSFTPYSVADTDHFLDWRDVADAVTHRSSRVVHMHVTTMKCRPLALGVLEFKFFSELSLEETAEALGVSQGTVMRDWMLAKARSYLRESIDHDYLQE